MRINDLQPGMICYRFGKTPVEVVEVVRKCSEAGIHYSHVVVRDKNGNEEKLWARYLQSKEQVEAKITQADQRAAELTRIQSQLAEYLPSVQTSNGYLGRENPAVDLSLDQEDCLRILDALGKRKPVNSYLPSSGGSSREQLYKAVLLAQRVRRAAGEGYCSKWNFPRMEEWEKADQQRMHMTLSDQALSDLYRVLSGRESGSVLERMFS